MTDFGATGEWRVIEDFGRPGLYGLERSEAAAAPGFAASSRFSWAPGGVGLKGFRPGGPQAPLPALVSPEFLEVADALVGDEVVLGISSYSLPLKVVGQVDYFPTMDPADGPFAIVDIDAYTRGANRYSPIQPGRSNELWLSAGGEMPPTEQLVDAVAAAGVRVTETNISARMVAQRVGQPLVGAGWGALLVLLFLAMTLATASGVMLYSYLDTRERQAEFALLRTLGSSGRQLNLVLWFNLLFMIACGVGLGTWLGFLIGGALLPLMEVVEGGARVTPPHGLYHRPQNATCLLPRAHRRHWRYRPVVGLVAFPYSTPAGAPNGRRLMVSAEPRAIRRRRTAKSRTSIAPTCSRSTKGLNWRWWP